MKLLKHYGILFAGPLPPPITGQSFSFVETVSVIDCKKKYVVNQNFEGKQTVIKWIKTIRLFPKYLSIFLFYKVDLVYFTSSRSYQGSFKDVLLILLSAIFRKKIVNHIHGANFKGFIDQLPPVYKRLVLFLYNKISIHVILLEEMRKQISPFVNMDKLEVIANFYDPVLDQYPLKNKNNEELTICFFSNVLYSKGVFDLIVAFNSLNSLYKNLKLKIAGKYMSDEYLSDEEVIMKLQAELDKNENITYLGVLTGKAKASFLASCHIFVLPTFYKEEAFPISMLEAMRCGCVLICSDHNYIKHIFSTKSGSLVKAGDTTEIAAVIKKYLDNPSLLKETAEFNIEYAKKNFSLHAYSILMNRLFESVIQTENIRIN